MTVGLIRPLYVHGANLGSSSQWPVSFQLKSCLSKVQRLAVKVFFKEPFGARFSAVLSAVSQETTLNQEQQQEVMDVITAAVDKHSPAVGPHYEVRPHAAPLNFSRRMPHCARHFASRSVCRWGCVLSNRPSPNKSKTLWTNSAALPGTAFWDKTSRTVFRRRCSLSENPLPFRNPHTWPLLTPRFP